MKENFYTGNEAAKYLGVHPQTIKNWRKSGKLVPSLERDNLTLYGEEYLAKIKVELARK